ncbi:MAG: ABC transporter permease [Armatimonadetes bacterium]|nr:ABC transporter permease [Armatimonadota bacterium]
MREPWPRRLERYLINAYVLFICAFIMAPILVVVLSSFQYGQYLAYPIERYSLRWYTEALFRPEWRNALTQSLRLAVQTTVYATVAGILAGLALHYHDFRGKQALSVGFLSPLLMPELLTGLALLFYFANFGISGTYTALLLGHVLLALPYVIRLVLTALPRVSRNAEEAAMTLGANEFVTMMKITLPLISPAIRGGAVFAFMVSYNNVLLSLFLSTPRVTTLPVKIYQHVEFVADPTIAAVSTIFLILTFALMVALERTVKLEVMPVVEEYRK